MKTTYPPLDYWVKVWPFIFRCIVVILLLLGCAGQGLTAGPNDTKPWRSGWMAPWKSDLSEEEKDDAILSAAKDLNFQALIINGTPERVQEFSIKAREFGIDIYSCLRPKSPEGGDKSQFEQSMPLSDVELLNKLKSNPQEWKNTYQFGGGASGGP